MRICHSRTWQSPLSGGPDVVKWKSCLPKQQHPSYSSPCVMMPFARRPIHQRWFDTSCLISFVLPGKSQGNFWFRYNVAVSVTKWLHGGASWAWEVDLVSPGFRSRDVGTQLEWICSCKAIGNNNGSHAEGWSNYFSDAPPARWFGDDCYPDLLWLVCRLSLSLCKCSVGSYRICFSIS